MKKAFSIIIVLFIFFYSSIVWAQGPAGIVLYFQTDNEAYLLLADHAFKSMRTRGWGAFGGASEKGESLVETAARETCEETCGYYKKEYLLEKIADNDPVMDNGFALFFAEVTFVPAQRVANNVVFGSDISHRERGPYAWIPFSDIEKYLTKEIDLKKRYPVDEQFLPGESYSRHYWSMWLVSMKNAYDRGRLPWLK